MSTKKYMFYLFFIIFITVTCISIAACFLQQQASNSEILNCSDTKLHDYQVCSEIVAVLEVSPVILIFDNIIYYELFDINKINEELVEVNNAIYMLENELSKEYVNTDIYESNNSELARLIEIKTKFEHDLNCLLTWESEYYYATKVWEYFRSKGYNAAVTAGILGNMMVETAGGTLDLKPTIYSASKRYYGLCQWSLKYYPDVANILFESQLDYLVEDMPIQFKTFGKLYRYNFTYEDFLAIESPTEAAHIFAKVYERCGSRYYTARKKAAERAYEYFMGSCEIN